MARPYQPEDDLRQPACLCSTTDSGQQRSRPLLAGSHRSTKNQKAQSSGILIQPCRIA
jgi:hypothetical protein